MPPESTQGEIKGLGFKVLTPENYTERDSTHATYEALIGGIGRLFPGAPNHQQWAAHFLSFNLDEQVPAEIRSLYEVARGAMLYGYFFYPLYTLGTEQLFRITEAAIRQRFYDMHQVTAPDAREKLDRDYPSYADKLGWLETEGVLPGGFTKEQWKAGKNLRNMASHPERQSLFGPDDALTILKGTCERINGLFAKK